MKLRNLFIGVIVIFIGVVALLSSLNVIDFSWHVVLRLWPLLLILYGVSILPVNGYLKTALLVLVLGAGCLLYHYEEENRCGSFCCSSIVRHGKSDWLCDDDDVPCGEGPFVQEFSEPFGAYSHAVLNVGFGAGEFEIMQPCAELVKVNSYSDFVKYCFLVENDGDSAHVTVSGRGSAKGMRGKVNNELGIALSDVPLWTLNIEAGASDCDFDFSPYKVDSLNVKAGVCDMDIRLGDRGCDTKLQIESGVSDIKIEIPASMDCRIMVDAAPLSVKTFEGFEKSADGVWQTFGYGTAANSIVIQLDCGVSDIEVERY